MVGQQTNGAWSYFGYDGLGSVRQMYDPTGALTYAANYDPYGVPFEQYGLGGALGFTGEHTDANGLQYLRARYYNPTLGTFLSRDPVMGMVGGQSIRWNPYSYAGANPVNYVDPSGKFFGLAALALGAFFFARGAGVDIAMQMVFEGRSLSNIDWGSALLSGGIDVATGGIGTYLKGAGYAAKAINRLDFIADVALSSGVDIFYRGYDPVSAVLGNAGFGAAFRVGFHQAGRALGWAGGKLGWHGGGGVAPNPRLAAACNSFSADTTIATENGDVPISQIQEGDEVLAYNEATGETGEYTVTDTISHVDESIIHLTIDDELIETTVEHPFYTIEGEWVNAGELEPGDQIWSLDGDYGTVESVEVIEDANQSMYNLTVDEAHTFFVGDGDWLVHNEDLCNVPQYALGNLGDDTAVYLHNRATLALYEPSQHTWFSGVGYLDSGRWLAYPSGDTVLPIGASPDFRVGIEGGHRVTYQRWRAFDSDVPRSIMPEGGLVGFTLNYRSKDQFFMRWRSTSINYSTWFNQLRQVIEPLGFEDIAPEMHVYILPPRAGNVIAVRAPVRTAVMNATGLSAVDFPWSITNP